MPVCTYGAAQLSGKILSVFGCDLVGLLHVIQSVANRLLPFLVALNTKSFKDFSTANTVRILIENVNYLLLSLPAWGAGTCGAATNSNGLTLLRGFVGSDGSRLSVEFCKLFVKFPLLGEDFFYVCR